MASVRVKLKLPAIAKEFNASYSQVIKPSGVGYTLLTIIGTGSLREQTWGRVMEMMRIPEDLSESMFWPELEKLESNGMIRVNGIIGPDSHIGVAEFTELGRQAFDKGVITQRPEEFHGTVVNYPAESSERYRKYSSERLCSPEGFDQSRFDDIEPDDGDIENKVVRDKSEFNVGESMEVFDVRINPGKAVMCYEKDVSVSMDPVTGNFAMDAKGLDENFAKSRFSAEDIISSVPARSFESFSKDASFTGWRDSLPDWPSMSFMLPADIRLGGHRAVFVNGACCRSEVHMDVGDVLGCDMMTIDSSESGAEYCLVRRKTAVEGLEGTVSCNLVVRRTVDGERIEEVVRTLVQDMDISSREGFERALTLAALVKSDDLSMSLVRERLRVTADIITEIKAIQNHRKDEWYKIFKDIVEEAIVDRGMTPREASDILAATKVPVSGYTLTDHYASAGEDPLGTVDRLFDLVSNKAALVRGLHAEEAMAEMVLSCEPLEGLGSSIGLKASNLARNLGRLKSCFGMASMSEYAFDLDGFDADGREEVVKAVSTFNRDLRDVSRYIPEARGLREIESYSRFFNEMSSAFKAMGGNEDPAKADDRQFGIIMGVRLENYLSAYADGNGIGEKLVSAYEQGRVSNADYESLNGFRKFRNQCAHSIQVDSIDKSQRTEWMRVIENLNPDKKIPDKKGKSKGGKR